MSLFSSLATAILTEVEGQPGTTGLIAKEVMQHLQQNQGGGLSALVEQLGQQGLGEIAKSWIGNGPNQSISPQQVSQVLGGGMLQQLAAKFGISPEAMSAHLSEILPKVVDQLTPDGKLPAAAAASAGSPAASGQA